RSRDAPCPAGARRTRGSAGRSGALAAVRSLPLGRGRRRGRGQRRGRRTGARQGGPAQRRYAGPGRAGAEVQVPPPPGDPVAPRPVEGITILHDDDDLVVVDKPVGVAAHPSPGWDGPPVIGGLAAAGDRISTAGAAERQGVVHRLDAATTGVMVVAKSERAYTALKAAFKERTVEKGYHALVQGHPDPSRGTIDAPIDR